MSNAYSNDQPHISFIIYSQHLVLPLLISALASPPGTVNHRHKCNKPFFSSRRCPSTLILVPLRSPILVLVVYSGRGLFVLGLLYIYDVGSRKNHTGNGKKELRYYLRLASVPNALWPAATAARYVRLWLCVGWVLCCVVFVCIWFCRPPLPQKALTVTMTK